MTTDRDRAVIDEFRANAGKVGDHPAGANLVLLTSTGAKSGQSLTIPVAYHQDGERLIIVASKGGAPKNPGWYHNLVANPAVTVEFGSEKFSGRAEVAADKERDRLYEQHAAKFPQFHDYAKQTTRQIPVVILTREP